MKVICYWADGTWTDIEYIEEYTYMSDDYTTIPVSLELEDEDIDRVVEDLLKGIYTVK